MRYQIVPVVVAYRMLSRCAPIYLKFKMIDFLRQFTGLRGTSSKQKKWRQWKVAKLEASRLEEE